LFRENKSKSVKSAKQISQLLKKQKVRGMSDNLFSSDIGEQ